MPLGLKIRFDTDPTCYSSFVSRPQDSGDSEVERDSCFSPRKKTHERKKRQIQQKTARTRSVTADHKSTSESDAEIDKPELTKHDQLSRAKSSENVKICCTDITERNWVVLFIVATEMSICLTIFSLELNFQVSRLLVIYCRITATLELQEF